MRERTNCRSSRVSTPAYDATIPKTVATAAAATNDGHPSIGAAATSAADAAVTTTAARIGRAIPRRSRRNHPRGTYHGSPRITLCIGGGQCTPSPIPKHSGDTHVDRYQRGSGR